MEKLIERIQDPVPGSGWKGKLDTAPRIGFVFTGQGAQWFGMGRSLIEKCPLFLQTLQKCDAILQALPSHRPSWSVVEELLKSQEDTMLGQTEYSQPICTAIQLALIDVLAQWGVKPSGVVGHSSGELAATYAAGLLSFENALVAAYYRGVHMGSGAAASGSVPGAMMAVGMTEAEVTAELEPYSGRIAVAAMNSPSSFTVSGDEDAVVELQQVLSDRKVFARRLQVAQAYVPPTVACREHANYSIQLP
jgi:acyl transferase domain-containing protein